MEEAILRSSGEEGSDLRAVLLSDVGCVRTNNEDAARFVRPTDPAVRQQKGYLAVLADGMGGHAAGEVASQMAVELVAETYYERTEGCEESLYLSLSRANRAVWQAAGRNARQRGMGTTCTAVAILDATLYVAHVGDSRLYLLKKGQLFQLTTDHTHVQTLVEQGVITPGEAISHPERNVLTRALGTHNQVEIDSFEPPHLLESEDRLLLCSDGLYDYLNAEEIAEYMNRSPISEAVRAMVELAKQRGGHDNITVLLMERVPAGAFQSARPTEKLNVL